MPRAIYGLDTRNIRTLFVHPIYFTIKALSEWNMPNYSCKLAGSCNGQKNPTW